MRQGRQADGKGSGRAEAAGQGVARPLRTHTPPWPTPTRRGPQGLDGGARDWHTYQCLLPDTFIYASTATSMSPRPLGFATASILKAIRDGQRYGLEIIDGTGLGGGTVYKVLGRLEGRGLVRGRWEAPEVAERERRPRRRYYELTPQGQTELAESLERFHALAERPRGKRRAGGPLPGEG